MAWLIFRWGPTRDMQQWIINGVDFSAIPSKNEYENLRAHNFVDLALICTILGSTDIYSKRAFQLGRLQKSNTRVESYDHFKLLPLLR